MSKSFKYLDLKNGCMQAYGSGKSITKYYDVKPSHVELMKQVGTTKNEVSEQVEMAKRVVNA